MSITRLRIAPGYFFVKWGSRRSIMRLVWGLWGRLSGPAGRVLWSASLAFLGVVLAVHAARAQGEVVELERRSGALGRQIERAHRDNQ